jgi:glycogen operon protein
MSEWDWNDREHRALGALFDGEAIAETDAHGQRIVGDTLLILFNACATGVTFTLPVRAPGAQWVALADTADPESFGPASTGATRTLLGRSAVVLKLTM